jgi:pimeloyl-ACP methyl ester carboxylesterase
MSSIEFAGVNAGEATLHVAQAGPADGPLMLLLHGFPEFWGGWQKHIGPLADAGFRVWAPDQRGYNRSDKPPRIRDYTLDRLAADVIGLIDAAGLQQAILVGHDWGGAVAWWVAQNFPERVARLVIINVPHPLVMRRLLRTSPRQMLRSWYMFAIQIPGLVDWAARRNGWRDLYRGMQSSSLPGTFGDEQFEAYREAWSQPAADASHPDSITTMLHWYRAMFRYGAARPKHDRIEPPTLILWGRRDKFIGPEGAERSLAMCERGELAAFPDNTHWLQHERPEEVVSRIVAFCRRAE